MKVNKPLGLLIVFAVVISAFAYFFLGGEGKTLLYFNAESDLPNQLIYEKRPANASGPPVHIIAVDSPYDVFFTIASLEKKPTTYTYDVSSALFNATENVVLSSKESKKIHVKIAPKEYQKWKLDSNTSSTSTNMIDMTKESWLAERKDFQILMRDGFPPVVVEENYHLPISSEVSHFGRIYHINISSLDELRGKPFVKEYTSERIEDFEKTSSIDLVNLSIVDNKLSVVVESERVSYISEESPFVVKLFRETRLEDIKVDKASDVELPQDTISFWYKIK